MAPGARDADVGPRRHGSAHAADFDEKLKAPTMKDPAELRSQAQAYSARFSAIPRPHPNRSSGLGAGARTIRHHLENPARHRRAQATRCPGDSGIRRWPMALCHRHGRTPGVGRSEPDDHGVVDPRNLKYGSRRWSPGFRPEDVALLRDYAATHTRLPPLRLRHCRSRWASAAPSASTTNSNDRCRRPRQSFWYSVRAASESNRPWVDSLMKRLDAQRGRILVSCFLELNRRCTGYLNVTAESRLSWRWSGSRISNPGNSRRKGVAP
jgi:hypothetical protein